MVDDGDDLEPTDPQGPISVSLDTSEGSGDQPRRGRAIPQRGAEAAERRRGRGERVQRPRADAWEIAESMETNRRRLPAQQSLR